MKKPTALPKIVVFALCCLPVFLHAEPLSMKPCDDASADPWIAELRDRVVHHSGLARYATDRFGASRTCRGRVTAAFDGHNFGSVQLTFADQTLLIVETFPPESSRVTLRVPSGFTDDEEARRLLRDYIDKVGLEIDWSKPMVTTENTERIERYESADPGFNGSAELIFTHGRLTTLRFSMAP